MKSLEAYGQLIYDRIIVATSIIFVPMLFKLVFGYFPLAYIRSKAWKNTLPILAQDRDNYLCECIDESRTISERINRNSTVYLFVGCLIAIIGVLIFWMTKSKSPFTTTLETDYVASLFELLPRFGILVFIESIAFYFLRQHRRTLEEYRYYEAIKRFRQRQRVFFDTIEKYKDSPELLKIVVDFLEKTDGYRMSDKEVDMRIEIERIMSQEMDPSAKITEMMKILKS